MTDPTFYRSPAEAIAAPRERLAYVAAFDRSAQRPDAMTVVDVDPDSDSYGRVVGWTDMPGTGDELHHFGWNACSSALKHEGHDMHDLARRYLLVPGLRSSRLYVFDTRPNPQRPRLVKTVDAAELAAGAGYSRPHTLHCGPDGVFLTCLGGGNGNGADVFSTSTEVTSTSTSPVTRLGLSLPSGRRETTPSTLSTYSLRNASKSASSWNTHWVTPSRSRRSTKATPP